MLCVHVGPGRLGLGLIVEQVLEAGFDVCLVGRAGGGERRQFGLNITDPERGLSYVPVRWVSNCAGADDLDPAVLEIIADPAPLLITCALERAIAERRELVQEIVSRRPAGAETVLLPCENDPAEAYQALEQHCGAALTMLPCVVDRICDWSPSGPRDGFGRRMVQAHPVGEWVIASAGALQTLERLRAASMVHVTRGAIDGWKSRKLWCVNGLHIVLALIARREGVEHLPLAGAILEDFVRVARPLTRQIGAGVTARWSDIPCDHAYASDRIRAFVESPDTTSRLLGRHLRRHDLTAFMDRLNTRLGDAARAAHAADQDCAPFADVVALVVTTLEDPNSYYAADGAERPALDADVDERVLQGFAACWRAGWTPPRRPSRSPRCAARSRRSATSRGPSSIDRYEVACGRAVRHAHGASTCQLADLDVKGCGRLPRSMVIELDTLRLARCFKRLAQCRDDQAHLRTEEQLAGALAVLELIGTPRDHAEATVVADALGFAVDALCNASETARARELATETVGELNELTPQRGGLRLPRSLPAARASRVLAQAIELDGDPDDALRRLTGLDAFLRHHSEIGAPLSVAQERLRVLRALHSAAKRDGGRTAHLFAARARHVGDPLAVSLEAQDPESASGYYHRAGCELRSRGSDRATSAEALDLLARSMPLRPDSPRDRRTRGMAEGEIRILRGDREQGAEILTHTVHDLRDVLPRHHESALKQLIQRDLLRAS